MKFAEAELRQITQQTWTIVVGEELLISSHSVTPTDIEDCIAACTQITGDWQLAVVLYCSTTLAQHVAALMFGTEEATTTMEDTHDAMCELVNIISGNIKGMLSGSNHLSLPNLVKGQDFELMFPRHVALSDVGFTYKDHALIAIVLGEDKAAPGKDGRVRRANGAQDGKRAAD